MAEVTNENILNWTVESKFGVKPSTGLSRLGAQCVGFAEVETRMSAMVRCPSCKSEAIEVSARMNGEARAVTMSGIPCPRCGETITLQWDARITFDASGNGKCGGLEIVP